MISSIKQRLSQSFYWKDIIWQASGNSLAQAIGILSMPILTRIYTPHDFAILNIFIQIVSFATIIMTWRYEYFINLPKDEHNVNLLIKLITLMSFFGLIITTPVIYLYKDSISILLNEASLAMWLIFAPVTAMLISISITLQQLIQRQQDYRNSGLSEITNKSGYAVSGILGYFLLPNIAGLILATTTGTLCKILWITRSLKNKKIIFRKSPIDFFQLKKTAIFYSKLSSSLVFSHIMLAFTGGIPVFFIASNYGSETLGQFALVISTLYLPSSLIGNAIGQVYFQRAAKRHANGESFNDLWSSTAKHLLIIGTPLFISIALVSPWAYPFMFGEKWENAGHYAVFLSIGAFFSFVTSPLDRACIVVNAWWYISIWHTLRAITTGLVAWIAWINQWSFENFLTLLVSQMVLMYLIDYFAEWNFSSNSSKATKQW